MSTVAEIKAAISRAIIGNALRNSRKQIGPSRTGIVATGTGGIAAIRPSR
jgi:hypothetical protein